MLKIVETHTEIGDENAHARQRDTTRVAFGAARERAVGARPDAVAKRRQLTSLSLRGGFESRQPHARGSGRTKNICSFRLHTRQGIGARIERAGLTLQQSNVLKLLL